ncbi:MAG TPA: dihydroorotase [Clostridiales bacterium]|nr:dihydroorotase [Clostridiales bacterium]
MIYIKDISIVDGVSEIPYKGDIVIDMGKIVKIGKGLDVDFKNAITINGKGLHILPGLVDMHCHLREPGYEYKEDIESGTKSAAAGGFTSISAMANTNPPIDNGGMVNFIKSRAKEVGIVKVYPIATITKGLQGKEITEIGELYEAGAVALSDDGMPVKDSNVMKLALQYSRMFNMLIISHCEDLDLAADGVMNEGYMSTILGLKGINRAAEEIGIARDIILAKHYKTHIHIAHVSTSGSVELIRQAKHEGIPITCETAPHYFSATDEWVDGYDTNTKVNPPLRTVDDVEAIKKGLMDGTIDVIATDHAPHHMDEKNIEYNLAAFGISGFETAFSLAYTNLVEQGIFNLSTLVEKMSSKPANILGIDGGKIKEGCIADMTIVDLNREYIVDVDNFYSKGKNNPFNGKKLKGQVLYTIVDGKIVYEKGKIV